MSISKVVQLGLSLALAGSYLQAQTATGTTATVPGKALQPNVVVFTGDNVIPQLVDGGGWKTTLKFVNLDNHPVGFTVFFFGDDGSDMFLPVLGYGIVRNLQIGLPIAGSITIETAGTAFGLSQGWAKISQDNIADSIGGFAIFRQRVPNIPDQEAVVPIVNQFSSHFVLLFDNVGFFTTAIALANPSQQFINIPVNIRNEDGFIIDQRFFSLGPYQHAAFTLASQWSSTAGRRGAIEFITSGFGVGALGLRFNGFAFTSFNILENFNWQ